MTRVSSLQPSPIDSPAEETSPLFADEEILAKFYQQTTGTHPAKLPASLLSLEIRYASLRRTGQALSEHSGWQIAFSETLRERRVSASIQKASTAQIMAAFTVLWNARQRIQVEQTPAQLAFEAELLDQNLSLREKVSALLADKLAPLLTPEQKDSLARGNEVPIPLSALSPELRKLTEEYIQVAQRGLPVEVDNARLKDFSIVFLPRHAGSALGVDGDDRSGGRIGF